MSRPPHGRPFCLSGPGTYPKSSQSPEGCPPDLNPTAKKASLGDSEMRIPKRRSVGSSLDCAFHLFSWSAASPTAQSASGGFSVETPAPRAGLAQTRLSEHTSEHAVMVWEAHICRPPGKGPCLLTSLWGCPWWLTDKEPACNAGDPGSIPGSGTYPGEGHGKLLQDSCLGNPMQTMGSQRVRHN